MGNNQIRDLDPALPMQISKSVIKIGGELGRGAYGRVYKVKYRGEYYAAKEIHDILIYHINPEARRMLTDSFKREIMLCSSLNHHNIVQFVGIFYKNSESLPIMVMELMDSSLTSYVRGQPYVSSTTKTSILHDVSLALCYLHSQQPPIIHRDLSPNNVMLKSNLPHPVAKIGDLGVSRTIQIDNHISGNRLTGVPGTVDFMPPECFSDRPIYDTSLDIFSYGGIALFVIHQEWPTPTAPTTYDPITCQVKARSEIERRHKFLNFQDGPLKQLILACLSNDPGARPSARRIEAFLSSLKNNKEEVLAWATKKLTQQQDEVKKVKYGFCCKYHWSTF